MQQTRFDEMECPIARSLDAVGEWWTLLILRDVFDGYTRFEDIQQNIGIAPTMLTRRLKTLVASGVLDRRQYLAHPPRFEYVLTDAGRDLRPVILALYAWGDRHRTDDGRHMVLVDTVTGDEADPLLVDRSTGLPLTDARFAFVPGPAASAGMAERINGIGDRLAGATPA